LSDCCAENESPECVGDGDGTKLDGVEG